jgi:adenylosuccinate synthase
MSSIAVLGCAWGDEAKAKIADVLSEDVDMVVRFQGGNNAGHTIFLSGTKYVFHILPCGALNPNTELVIASGCVLNLKALKSEIRELEKSKLSVLKRVRIYGTATLIVFTERLDVAKEIFYSKSGNIGTTRTGIGPTYERIAARDAIRFVDIFSPEKLRVKLKKLAREINVLLRGYKAKTISKQDIEKELKNLLSMAKYFSKCIVDDDYIYFSATRGKKILYEGAQGALLDPYHGSYPYVTSHPTTYGAILTSCGIGLDVAPKRVVGVVKAYFTRVGNGPFPTLIYDEEIQNNIRELGHEYGASTGRPRDCGWLDMVLLTRAVIMNGVTEIALTCIDTLCKIGKVKMCVKYEEFHAYNNGPGSIVVMSELDSVTPHYWELDLSGCSMDGVKKWQDIPEGIKEYIATIQHCLGIPVTMISYGRDRNQILIKKRFE